MPILYFALFSCLYISAFIDTNVQPNLLDGSLKMDPSMILPPYRLSSLSLAHPGASPIYALVTRNQARSKDRNLPRIGVKSSSLVTPHVLWCYTTQFLCLRLQTGQVTISSKEFTSKLGNGLFRARALLSDSFYTALCSITTYSDLLSTKLLIIPSRLINCKHFR
jgi:hypothetical protein